MPELRKPSAIHLLREERASRPQDLGLKVTSGLFVGIAAMGAVGSSDSSRQKQFPPLTAFINCWPSNLARSECSLTTWFF